MTLMKTKASAQLLIKMTDDGIERIVATNIKYRRLIPGWLGGYPNKLQRDPGNCTTNSKQIGEKS